MLPRPIIFRRKNRWYAHKGIFYSLLLKNPSVLHIQTPLDSFSYLLPHDCLTFDFCTSVGGDTDTRLAFYSRQAPPIEMLGERYLISLSPAIFQGDD